MQILLFLLKWMIIQHYQPASVQQLLFHCCADEAPNPQRLSAAPQNLDPARVPSHDKKFMYLESRMFKMYWSFWENQSNSVAHFQLLGNPCPVVCWHEDTSLTKEISLLMLVTTKWTGTSNSSGILGRFATSMGCSWCTKWRIQTWPWMVVISGVLIKWLAFILSIIGINTSEFNSALVMSLLATACFAWVCTRELMPPWFGHPTKIRHGRKSHKPRAWAGVFWGGGLRFPLRHNSQEKRLAINFCFWYQPFKKHQASNCSEACHRGLCRLLHMEQKSESQMANCFALFWCFFLMISYV